MSKGSLNARSAQCCAEQAASERDEHLVEKVAAGNEQALEELIRRHSTQVSRVCRRICHDETEINCLVSEVFWELWNRAGAFDPSRGSVRTFLMMVARSRSIDNRRSAAARQRVQNKLILFSRSSQVDLTSPAQPTIDSMKAERSVQVREALDRLPLSQRQAIELAFFDGCTHDEVARQLNAPLGTVKSRIRSGLMQLKQSLPEEYCSEEIR